MYAFNRRLEPQTLLGLPIKTAAGLLFGVGGLVCAIAFQQLWAFLLLAPFSLIGFVFAIVHWRRRGDEHLSQVLFGANRDMTYLDLGIVLDE